MLRADRSLGKIEFTLFHGHRSLVAEVLVDEALLHQELVLLDDDLRHVRVVTLTGTDERVGLGPLRQPTRVLVGLLDRQSDQY